MITLTRSQQNGCVHCTVWPEAGGESSAREARAKILVYVYIYMYCRHSIDEFAQIVLLCNMCLFCIIVLCYDVIHFNSLSCLMACQGGWNRPKKRADKSSEVGLVPKLVYTGLGSRHFQLCSSFVLV